MTPEFDVTDYKIYMASNSWRKNPARLLALSNVQGHCRVCHDDGPLEVHHATYERLGCERENDLIPLCRNCHHEVTNFLRSRRYAASKPKWADVIQLRDGRVPANDPTAVGY
jgi:5-methylcytosine-specific restriction endonuclease McrA